MDGILNIGNLINMQNKKITYSYNKYEGHDNEQIMSLINELNECKLKQITIDKLIKEIQDNCIHEYMFVSNGAYDDNYTCKKCGHDNYK